MEIIDIIEELEEIAGIVQLITMGIIVITVLLVVAIFQINANIKEIKKHTLMITDQLYTMQINQQKIYNAIKSIANGEKIEETKKDYKEHEKENTPPWVV